jgi:DNA-binding IclR family transcriptional regulator
MPAPAAWASWRSPPSGVASKTSLADEWALPIRDASGQTVAAISVTGTTDSTDEAQLRALIPVVRRVAESISEKIGGRLG